MTTTSITTSAGTATIESKLFSGYAQEANTILDNIRERTLDFKEFVETVAETTKLEKKVVSKYFKARFKVATKEAKAEGDLFEQLDTILE